ncbi:MAG: metallopeptidase TldD-related protein [Polyangiales bacterium]
MLAGLGVGSASLLLAFGCGAPVKTVNRAPQVRNDVRTWLRDAVSRLATVYPQVHALAVSRRRTTAAIDILGTGVARTRRDGVVFTVRDKDGMWRELATAELTRDGVQTAVRALAPGAKKQADLAFPEPPPAPKDPVEVADDALRNRVGAIMRQDKSGSSRIVYAAALIDIDDVTLWSIGPGMDLEHQVRRVRKRATRAAWNGSRPSVNEVQRGWVGDVDDQQLSEEDVTNASLNAMLLMTPGVFEDGEQTLVLEPNVSATIIDAAVSGLLTSSAARRPEVTRRLASGAAVASPQLTLLDDPNAPHAYGGFPFDDDGAPASSVVLLDQGVVAGRLSRARRPGHIGGLVPMPSHLMLLPGTAKRRDLVSDGWLLEGKVGAVFDPASDRIVVAVARARELKAGGTTGRVYADVELVGDLATLLAAVTGVAAESETTVIRDEIDGEPIWRSIQAPWLRTRGMVRARRRAT